LVKSGVVRKDGYGDRQNWRQHCSQLQAIPDAAYEAGLGRLARELADADGQRARADHLCLITIRGEKPADAF
jgi:hypothetical protein